ncbi:MAG: hypothetical protein H6744_12555 [Deltaproteobacteria bacterium]|nr:hypothetical protein [Deltaproteobacteria bacterium]
MRASLVTRRVAVVACFAAGLASGGALRALRAERGALAAAERNARDAIEARLDAGSALSRLDDDTAALRALLSPWSQLADSAETAPLRARAVRELAAATSGAEVRDAQGSHLGPVTSIAVLPTAGAIATASKDRTVRLWRADGRALGRLSGFSAPVEALRFAAAAPRLVTADAQGQVAVWEIPSGEAVAVFDAPRSSLLSDVAMMPRGDGVLMAAGRAVWLRPIGGERTTLVYQGNARAVSLDVDSQGRRIASGHEDGTVIVWRAEDLQVRVLSTASGAAPESPPVALRFRPGTERQLVALTAAGGLRVWDIEGEEWPIEARELDAQSLGSLSFSEDGSIGAALGDGEVLRLPLGGLPALRFGLRGPRTTALGFAAPNMLVVGGSDGSVRFTPLELGPGELLGRRPAPVLTGAVDSRTGQIHVLDDSGGLAVLPKGPAWTTPWIDDEPVRPTVAVASRDGMLAAAGTQVLAVSPGAQPESPWTATPLCEADAAVLSLAEGPTGRTIFGSASGVVGACAADSTKVLSRLDAEQPIALAASASLIAIGTDAGRVVVVDPAGKQRWARPERPDASPAITSIVIMDGGDVIAGARDGALRRFDARGELVGGWQLPGCALGTIALSEASGRVAAGCADGSVRLVRFDVPGVEVLRLQVHRGAVTWCSLDAAGETLTSAGVGGSVVRVPLHEGDGAFWAARACAWLRADPALELAPISGCRSAQP